MGRSRRAGVGRCLAVVLAVSAAPILLGLTGCGGVAGVKWTPMGGATPAFEPYQGEVRVLWKSHGFPEDLKAKKYQLLGRVSGRSFWCGSTPPIQNTQLHNRLTEEAGRHGGNAIMLDCGYGGFTEAQCYCYGDVMRFEE